MLEFKMKQSCHPLQLDVWLSDKLRLGFFFSKQRQKRKQENKQIDHHQIVWPVQRHRRWTVAQTITTTTIIVIVTLEEDP